MRIALLSAEWQPTGGVATYVRGLASALRADGHDVLVVHGEHHAFDAPEGIQLASVPDAFFARSAADVARTTAVSAHLSSFRPDVVHVQSNNNFPLEDAIRRQYPTTKTFHVHEYCPTGSKYHFGPDRACAVKTSAMCVPRMGYLRCTLSRRPNVMWNMYRHTKAANRHHRRYPHLVLCSSHLKQQATFTGFDPERLHVVPYFTAPVASTTNDGGQDVLFVGRLVRQKGVDLLLQALARVPGAWRGVVVGDGPERPRLRQQAAALGIADRVDFPGWLTGDALLDRYRQAAVVAVPSRWPEPFGIVGIEAMAHERPVVAFNVGGIPEWLEEGVGGSLVPALDVDAFAARLAWMLDHADDARQMAARGRARVGREFSARAHLEKLMPVYQRLC